MGFHPLWPVKKVLSLGLSAVTVLGEVCIGTAKVVGIGSTKVVELMGRTGVKAASVAGRQGAIIVRRLGPGVAQMTGGVVMRCGKVLWRSLSATARTAGGITFKTSWHLGKAAIWPGLAYGLAKAVAKKDRSLAPAAASFAAVEYGIYLLAKGRDGPLKLAEVPPHDKEIIFSVPRGVGEELKTSAEQALALNEEDELAALVLNAWSTGELEDGEYSELEECANGCEMANSPAMWASKALNGKETHLQEPSHNEKMQVARDENKETCHAVNDSKASNGYAEEEMEETDKENQGKGMKKEDLALRRVLFYSTTVRAVRKTFEACNSARNILEGYSVAVDERDVSMHAEFKEELQSLLGGRPIVPSIFIKGRLIGGFEELQKLNEEGKLRDILSGLPRTMSGVVCRACGNYRFCMCPTCDGSKKVRWDDEVQSCPDCNERGLQRCKVCA